MKTVVIAMEAYIENNLIGIVSIIIAYISLVLPIFKYIQLKRFEEKSKRFDNYHKLIGSLANEAKKTKLDSQIAIIFELRNFKEYFPVTLRILSGLKKEWGEVDDNKRLIEEIRITETYIIKNYHPVEYIENNPL